MRLEAFDRGDVTVFRVSGEFNIDSVARFNETVAERIAQQHRDFVVDLSGVTAIDSAGLEALTALQRRCEEQLGLLRIAGADATVRKILEITRLDRSLTLCDSTQEALGAFAKN